MSAALETAPRAPASVNVFGVGCFAGTLDEAAASVIERAASGRGGYAVLCNVHVLMTCLEEPPLRAAVEAAWQVFPDGAPVAWWQRHLGAVTAERVGGPDLMELVLSRGRDTGLRHAYLGATHTTLEQLESRVRSRVPGATIAGLLAPPFGDPAAWSAQAVDTVRSWRPDVVWLALGAPKQELWMKEWAPALAPAVVLGVGAAVDFQAGTRGRAPAWMQDVGLEWAHRLASEPKRLLGRYLRTNTSFVLRAVRAAALGERRDPDA